MKKPDSNFSVKIRNRAFSIHSLIYCDFQRKAQPECVESILEVDKRLEATCRECIQASQGATHENFSDETNEH